MVVLSGPTLDDYGDPVAGTGGPKTVQTLAPLEFLYSSESSEHGRAGAIVGVKVYLPAGTRISSTSQVRARGITYDVDGDVADWRSPTGSGLGGIEVALRRAVG